VTSQQTPRTRGRRALRPTFDSGVRPRPLVEGTVLGGRYRVDAPIAEGGMGEVHAAHDLTLDRPVALKVVRPGAADEERRRFLREAALTASVRHPNVVRVLDFVFVDDVAVLVLERLEGTTLRVRIEHEGALDLERGPRYLDQLLGALAACHRSRVVHRDVKPDNLIVVADPAHASSEAERLVLVDFGLGKPLARHTPLTADGVVVGTPGYYAPEQLLGRPVDERTDIHQFGVTAYEVLTGRRLFERDGAHATMLAVLTSEPPSVCEARPKVPPAVEGVLRHALAKDPQDRWDDVASLRRAWRRAWSLGAC
jgi:serine/threonine protein kinase